MIKGDLVFREVCERILSEGCLDKNPRPHWEDGTPAHTLSVNGYMAQYDASKGESPLITLRPIATKSSIGELLWIYQDQSNDLKLLAEKYGITWWDEWAVKYKYFVTEDNPEGYVLTEDGGRTILNCYGGTVREHDLFNAVYEGLQKDPDGRRHIIDMWQVEDFKKPHGLKPCCFLTNWNVRHGKDGKDYLDMLMYQRSSDFGTAGCINQFQYFAFMVAMASVLGYEAGIFTWIVDNVQIYDRHIEQIKEMLKREPLDLNPVLKINPNVKNWYDLKVEDFILEGYDKEAIKAVNPQLKFPVAI